MFVWGPWQFSTGASEQVASNRTTRPRAYSLTTGKNWDLDATLVAAWAGHSVQVLLQVYAKCIVGRDQIARRRIEAALGLTS